jgi:hypothetical protein
MQLERYQIEMLLGYHWLTCCCCFDEHWVLFCESEMVRVIHAGRFQRSTLIWVWIPTYPIQMNASYISWYCARSHPW